MQLDNFILEEIALYIWLELHWRAAVKVQEKHPALQRE